MCLTQYLYLLYQGLQSQVCHSLEDEVAEQKACMSSWYVQTSGVGRQVQVPGGVDHPLTCAGYLAHPFVKWMVLVLRSSCVWQLSFFTDEGEQVHGAYLHAFSESHPLPQRRWQRESAFQALQKQHDGTQDAFSSGSSTSLLKRSGHSSVLVVQPTQDWN